MCKNCTLRKKNVPNTWLHTYKYEMGSERDKTLNRVCACVLCKYSGGIMPMPLFAQPEPQPHRKALCIQAAAAAKIHWGVNSKETLTARACHARVESTTQQRCLAKIGARAWGEKLIRDRAYIPFWKGSSATCLLYFQHWIDIYVWKSMSWGMFHEDRQGVIWQSIATAVMSQFNVQTELFTS